MEGPPLRKWTVSPSPSGLKKKVTFEDAKVEEHSLLPTSVRENLKAAGSQLLSREDDLGHPQELDPYVLPLVPRW